MFTIGYKGFYINGYTDKDKCTVVYNHGGIAAKCDCISDAKLWIRWHMRRVRWINK